MDCDLKNVNTITDIVTALKEYGECFRFLIKYDCRFLQRDRDSLLLITLTIVSYMIIISR